MSPPTARMALSLRAAATELDVTPQRVNQLLSSGELQGPTYPGTRAPRGAPRVYADSLVAYVDKVSSAAAHRDSSSAHASLEARVAELERLLQVGNRGADSEYLRELRSRERAARSAALLLKVVADEARGALEAEQQSTAELRAENERLRTMVTQGERRSRLDLRAREALSESLTGFLTPDDLDAL